MDLGARHEDDIILVTPAGRLDLSTYVEMRDGLLKLAAEQPSAVIVELGDRFEIGSDTLASVFATVWLRIAQWSSVRLMLVALTNSHRGTLERSGVARFVPSFRSTAVAARSVPQRCRDEVQLGREFSAATVAREFVLRTCQSWDVGSATASAVLIAGELVENVIRHTACAPTLRIELLRHQLTVAVRDSYPWRTGDEGRGVALLNRLSSAWGRTPTLDGGKIVWATITL